MGARACHRFREAISARLDGEDPGLAEELLDGHLARCADCRRYDELAGRHHQRLRVRSAEAIPDLSESILAALGAEGAPPEAGRRRLGRRGTRRRTRRRLVAVAAAVVLVGLAATGILVESPGNRGSGRAVTTRQVVGSDQVNARYPGITVLPQPVPKPSVTLTDTSGQPYNLATATAGRVTLLYFGYTHCPDVCPINMALTSTAISRLPPAERRRVTVVFVTTDPARDTPGVIRSWLNKFDPAFVGLTGTPAQIRDAEEAIQMPLSYVETASDGSDHDYRVVHAGYTLVYSQDNMAHLQVDDTETPVEYAASLEHLLAAGYQGAA